MLCDQKEAGVVSLLGNYEGNASNAYWMNLIHNSKNVLKNPKVIEKLNKI